MIQGRIKSRPLLICLGVLLSSTPLFAKTIQEPEAVGGEFVVKLKDQNSLQGYIESHSLERLSGQLGSSIKSFIAEDNIVVVRRPLIETAQSAIKTLMQNPLVEVAEPNYIYRAIRSPNDPMLGNLWGMKNIGQVDSEGSTGVAGVDIDAERAWDVETGSERTIVAVIDTGIDYTHPDLKDNVWTNYAELNGQAGIDDDNNGYIDDIHGFSFADAEGKKTDPMDDHGHGSHCSGTIGARGNDASGIVGVNWNVRIMAVKFLGADGGGTLEGAIKGIDYATKMGAKILSNSWGGGGYSETLKAAIERAQAAGAIFIAAAGNDSANNDTDPHYPASYDVPNLLSVAAIDNKGALASFSNYGRKTVHVAAPGVNIYSSLPNGKYDSWSGTSMATPHVSGIAALLLSHNPELTGLQLKQRIMATAKPLAGVKNKISTGGLANAYNAVTNTQAPPDPNDPALWAAKTISIATPHPYKPKSKEEYEIKVEGAKEISIYFSKFETERDYDKVTIFDKTGKVVGVMSGNNEDTYSPIVSGDSARLVFESDDTVEKDGFEITKAAYR